MRNINQHTQRLLEVFLSSLVDSTLVEPEIELLIAPLQAQQAQFDPDLELCPEPSTALFQMLQMSLRRLHEDAAITDLRSVPAELHAATKLLIMLDLIAHERNCFSHRLDGVLKIHWNTLREWGISDALQSLCRQCLD